MHRCFCREDAVQDRQSSSHAPGQRAPEVPHGGRHGCLMGTLSSKPHYIPAQASSCGNFNPGSRMWLAVPRDRCGPGQIRVTAQRPLGSAS
ncbi:hypothetical protein TCAP_00564 [Tolypocladium capitatum]|uniref:Uncharacterized protein n=1 Tax=Tolypocladium capitatum TaxID=45235 RepID=A0A2K3QPS9_9HYPO|nr:hypothetical protein TCAP_00564 [Tolypocladium capitatum]